MTRAQFEHLVELETEHGAKLYIAYNRRFFASVIEAQKIISKDGGVTSFNFEFTEWVHEIEPLVKAPGVKEIWFLANSTHVVDLAFYLGGTPKELAAFSADALSWHPVSNFSGAGISHSGALFSYQANWQSAGRWVVEILTKNHRLIFKPMEKLQIQKRGAIAQEFVDINYQLDDKYKPGLFLQTQNFLNGDDTGMCTIKHQLAHFDIYARMVGDVE